MVGRETKRRKHIDWEIYSSMYDGTVNKKSGILVINLPTTNCTYYTASHKEEKEIIYPEISSWVSIDNRLKFEELYPNMPDRIIDNLLNPEANISVTNWEKITSDLSKLKFLIDVTFNDRTECQYDLSQPMRRKDS